MGWLAAQGAIMAIGLFIGLVCSVIGLFFVSSLISNDLRYRYIWYLPEIPEPGKLQ